MNDRERQLMGLLQNNTKHIPLQQSNVYPRFSGYDKYNLQSSGRLQQSALNILDSTNDYPSHRALQSIQEQNKLLANLKDQVQQFKSSRSQDEHYQLLHQINKQKLLTEQDDEDQFNQARKIQMKKPPITMPYIPTIYSTPYYNYQQPYQLYQQPQQQQQQIQQSKPQVFDKFLQLQMIQLMKSLNQSSSSEDSEEAREQEQKRTKKKMQKKPSVDESLHLQSDIDRLKELQKKRAKLNWRIIFIQYQFLLAFRRRLREIIQRRKTESTEKLLSLQQLYQQSSQVWFSQSCKQVIEMLKRKELNIQVTDQKISESTLQQNSIKLKEIVSVFVENICKNQFALNETTLYVLATLTQQYEHIANDILLQFELNRYKFTHEGAILECPKEMILITWIWLRSGIMQFLGMAFSDVEIETHFRQNLKAVYSILYYILIKYLLSITKIQENNQNHIIENKKIVANIDFYLDITYQQSTDEENKELQQSKNQGKDLPMLYPVFNENEQSRFIKKNIQFIDKQVEMIKNWSKEILSDVEQFHQNVIVKERYERIKKEKESRKINKDMHYLFLNRIQSKILLGKEIVELKANIAQKNQLIEKRKEQLLNQNKLTKPNQKKKRNH